MNDTITLANMAFWGRHGVYPYEQEYGQRFYVDIEISADLEQAARTDELAATVDYTAVYDSIKRIIETEHYQLLEALCGRIADSILQFTHVKRVVVRIRKPAVPLPGALDFVQVALVRNK